MDTHTHTCAIKINYASIVDVYKNEREMKKTLQRHFVFLSYIVILFIFFSLFVSHWLLQHARSHIQTNEPNTHTHKHTRGVKRKNETFTKLYKKIKKKNQNKVKIIHTQHTQKDSSSSSFKLTENWR